MKRAVLLILGIIVLALIPIYAATAPAATEVSEFDVIANAADDYLNDPDTVFNILDKDLCTNLLDSSMDNDPVILSIRGAEAYATGHVPRAVNMSRATLFEPENLAELSADEGIVVYCYTGHDGSQASALLNLCGYDVSNLKWGIMGWTKDTSVATMQFTNPTTDLPTETTINEPTVTYALPVVENTSSTDEAEIIRTACANYASSGFRYMTAADLYTLITDGDPDNDPVILSVRPAEVYAGGHIPGAINIPFRDIAKVENLQKLNPDKQIVVYCYTGRDGSQTTAILNALGYDAVSLKWGISGWTTDPVAASSRFNPATSADYPFETGAGDEAPEGPSGDTGGCG